MSGEEYEWRDGRRYRVTRLPDATPPPNRSARTRFSFVDVGKSGNLAPQRPTTRRRRGKRYPPPVRPDPGPAPERLTRTRFPFAATVNGEPVAVSRATDGSIEITDEEGA